MSAPASPLPAVVHSRVLLGLDPHAVTIECHVDSGLPSTTIVGLPEGAVREARDRIQSAIRNSGFIYPDGRVVINLAPGHVAKSGSFLDLPMAISVLAATQQVRTTRLAEFEFLGELGLFGELRQTAGALVCAQAARAAARRLIVPAANASEACLAPAASIGWLASLAAATELLNSDTQPDYAAFDHQSGPPGNASQLANVVGQSGAKRALCIAAAGGHHLLLVGPPGTGKTMLARGLRQLLPPLDPDRALQVAGIYSAAGLARDDYTNPPFRDPHHSASPQALIGGGRIPTPGELSLAHHGVLFLDELPHFKPTALNLMREPIETGEAVVARTSYNVRFPCRFQLIAAMNPCPAGRVCQADACRCSPVEVRRYQNRISGPLLDRIDLQVQVAPVPHHLLAQLRNQTQRQQAIRETDALVATVAAARQRQLGRQTGLNARLRFAELEREMQTAEPETVKLAASLNSTQISARSYHKIWRIARTIADVECSAAIAPAHFAEALSYRALDWEMLVR